MKRSVILSILLVNFLAAEVLEIDGELYEKIGKVEDKPRTDNSRELHESLRSQEQQSRFIRPEALMCKDNDSLDYYDSQSSYHDMRNERNYAFGFSLGTVLADNDSHLEDYIFAAGFIEKFTSENFSIKFALERSIDLNWWRDKRGKNNRGCEDKTWDCPNNTDAQGDKTVTHPNLKITPIKTTTPSQKVVAPPTPTSDKVGILSETRERKKIDENKVLLTGVYYFDRLPYYSSSKEFIPFLNAGLGYSFLSEELSGEYSQSLFRVGGGVHWLVSPMVSLFSEINIDRKFKNNDMDVNAQIGVSMKFGKVVETTRKIRVLKW